MAEPGQPRLNPPWGPKQAAMGLGLAVLAYAVSVVLIGAVSALFGSEFQVDDTALFDAAREMAAYTDERLQAAAEGVALPDPPTFTGDPVTARIVFVLGGLNALLIILAVMAATRRGPARLAEAVGLDREYRWGGVWRPVLVCIGAYVGVAVYAAIVTAIDIDLLEPEGGVPGVVQRDGASLIAFGVVAVIGAPLSEELLFRGLVFGGLLRWGFWPAAVVSGAGFSLAHADPGTFIPFTCIGAAFAWLYWRTGTLWDSIIAHGVFNAISFALVLATR